MKYYKLILEDEEISFKAPTSWSEVSYKKYCEYVGLVDKAAKEKLESGKELDSDEVHGDILSLFTGLDRDIWKKDVDISVYLWLDKCLNFISSEPKCDRMTDIKRKGKYYPIKDDFLNVSLGKYRDIMSFMSEAEGKDREVQMMSVTKMIAVFACIDYETEEELEKIAKEIECMPADEINTLGGFFLSKFLLSRNGTLEKLSQKELRILKNKQVTEKFLKIMASFTLYITLPVKMSRNIRRSLTSQLKRFIGLSNYKVVSVTQSKDILL